MNPATIIALTFVAFAVAEARVGRLLQPNATMRDRLIELVSGIGLPLVVIPGVFVVTTTLAHVLAPDSEGMLSHLPAWAMFGVLLLADDFTQYLYHRSSHQFPWLFRLHRAHHSAAYISVRITYRNNILYYAMMPGLWLSALLVYWGFGPVYFWYAIFKMFIVYGAHSNVAWDQWLIDRPKLSPLLWIIERLVSTPATHAAHHGRHSTDEATYYKGNYGNFLFLWDVLLGTAKITRKRPSSYGLENVPPASWLEELAWPLLGRRRD